MKPFDRLARFIGKSHKAIFDTCRYTATHIATEEVRRISEANALRARLHACPRSPIEPDEPIPGRLPLPYVDFPSAADFLEFFLTPADLSDGDGDDDEDAELSSYLLCCFPLFGTCCQGGDVVLRSMSMLTYYYYCITTLYETMSYATLYEIMSYELCYALYELMSYESMLPCKSLSMLSSFVAYHCLCCF